MIRELMKRTRANGAVAFRHALGIRLWEVVLILLLVSWSGDALFGVVVPSMKSLFHSWFDATIPSDVLDVMPHLVVFILAAAVLYMFARAAEEAKYSDRFEAQEGSNAEDKHVLIMVLSPHKTWARERDEENILPDDGEPAYTLEELNRNIDDLPVCRADALRFTRFQSNWLPVLKTLEMYPSIDKVIAITTSGERGSHHQKAGEKRAFNVFKRLVESRFEERYISIPPCARYLKDTDYESLSAQGVSSDDMVEFTNVLLAIIDKLLDEGKTKGLTANNIIVDVTGGMGSMSAALAAASVVSAIDIHYLNTNSFEKQAMDISVVGVRQSD